MKNSKVFSWGESYFELCSGQPLALMPSISSELRSPSPQPRINFVFAETSSAVPRRGRSKPKVLRRQPGLADDGAGGADGQFLLWMGHDGDASGGILVFGVAAFLGYEKETVLLEHTDDFGGTEPFRHSPSPDRC